MTGRNKIKVLLAVCITFAFSCKTDTKLMNHIKAPIAKKEPTKLEKHGDVRVDNYYWMNNREDSLVIAHLERENAFKDSLMAHTKDFQKTLFEEMKGRIKEDDSSVPYKNNGYWYITKYETGQQYPIFSRKKGTLDADEEIMFNGNEMAEGHEYFRIGGLSVSPDNTMAAYGVDTVSRRQYTLQVKNLVTGEIFKDKIDNTTGGAVWADDNKTLFYAKKDPVTLRSDKIYKHVLGTPESDDVLIHNETDDTFSTYVYKTKSKEFIVIGSYSTLTTEFQILKANNPNGQFKIFTPRTRGLEHNIAHYADDFYILTNKDGATNFKLMKVKEDNTTVENWKEFIPHRKDVLLEDIDIFKELYVGIVKKITICLLIARRIRLV